MLVKSGNGDLDNPCYSGTQASGSHIFTCSSMIFEEGKGKWNIISLNPVPLAKANYVAMLKFKGTGKPSPTIYPEDEENQDTGEDP